MKTANDLLFRASMVGHIMPSENARTQFTETCIEKMVEIYNSAIYQRFDEIESKFLEKGNVREEDSITLYCLNKKRMFRKNAERRKNDFVTGEWDLHIERDSIITETTDLKTCWSKNTFDKARVKKLKPEYKWQGVTYMWLTGAVRHSVASCLVNATENAVMDEKRRLAWKMGLIDPDSSETYKEKCKQIEINLIYDLEAFMKEYPHFDLHNDPAEWCYDIPAEERVHEITFERNEAEIIALQNRIIECRTWMNENFFKIRTKQAA